MEKNWINFNNMPEALFRLFGEVQQIKSLLIESSSETGLDEPLCINQASKILHIKKQTIYSYVSRNIIPYSKKAGRLYFSKNDLM